MTHKKEEKQVMHLQVAEGLQVVVIPNENHEFIIPTKDVAKGYGVAESTFRKHKKEHQEDLIEGKHFITVVEKSNASGNESITPYKRTYWTKRGIVRMGFFIKSGNAKLFRDWAEDLVLNAIGQQKALSLPAFEERKSKFFKRVHQIEINGTRMFKLRDIMRLIVMDDSNITTMMGGDRYESKTLLRMGSNLIDGWYIDLLDVDQWLKDRKVMEAWMLHLALFGDLEPQELN